jgi:hypothetical protein
MPTPRPKLLTNSVPRSSVNLPDAQWRVAIAVLTSAVTMMDSAVHAHATNKLIRDLSDQTGIVVTPVPIGEESE